MDHQYKTHDMKRVVSDIGDFE